MKNRTRRESGFSLLEMMLVVSIIAILATIAMPKMASAIQKAKEGNVRGNLGILRSALTLYRGDAGTFPVDLAALQNGYISEIPAARGLAYHNDSSAVRLEASPSDAGGWSYNNNPLDSNYGNVVVNCTHTDTSGRLWSQY